MEFTFVPRVVSKHAKPWQGIPFSPSLSPDLTTDSGSDKSDDEPGPSQGSKGKEKAIDQARSKQSQDIASLVSLALSDYSIWLDRDLRSKLDACLNDETSSEEAGFVPINYLLRRAPFRGSLPPIGNSSPEPSETEVVKALRTHANHVLEVRMCLPFSSSSVWYGTSKTSRKKDVGGYEVRRKDLRGLRDRPSRGWTRARWDALTIYMEGIPPQYRTIGGISRLVDTLVRLENGTETDIAPWLFRVQNVSLPPHYLDKPGDMPKCKGYALVTFSTLSHVETLLRAWPWKRRDVPHVLPGDEKEDARQIVNEAHKYGVRAISKARWDALNEEYLLYKQSLVEEIARTQTQTHSYQRSSENAIETQGDERQRHQTGDEPQPQIRTVSTSPYPFDCLVFVRNVHPETNKTTLRALFERASKGNFDKPTQAQAQPGGAGIDYVDFTKGMDTCYLRLASPHHATCLMTYLGARDIAQADGLDAVGRAPIQGGKPIAVEMVQNKREALYWEKVPEKVRRQAVDKVVKATVELSSPSYPPQRYTVAPLFAEVVGRSRQEIPPKKLLERM